MVGAPLRAGGGAARPDLARPALRSSARQRGVRGWTRRLGAPAPGSPGRVGGVSGPSQLATPGHARLGAVPDRLVPAKAARLLNGPRQRPLRLSPDLRGAGGPGRRALL